MCGILFTGLDFGEIFTELISGEGKKRVFVESLTLADLWHADVEDKNCEDELLIW